MIEESSAVCESLTIPPTPSPPPESQVNGSEDGFSLASLLLVDLFIGYL